MGFLPSMHTYVELRANDRPPVHRYVELRRTQWRRPCMSIFSRWPPVVRLGSSLRSSGEPCGNADDKGLTPFARKPLTAVTAPSFPNKARKPLTAVAAPSFPSNRWG